MQVKVAVPQTGIYYVPLEAALAAGLDANRSRLALTHNGDAVDYALSPDGTGVYFYGRDDPAAQDVAFLACTFDNRLPGGGSLVTITGNHISRFTSWRCHYQHNDADGHGLYANLNGSTSPAGLTWSRPSSDRCRKYSPYASAVWR